MSQRMQRARFCPSSGGRIMTGGEMPSARTSTSRSPYAARQRDLDFGERAAGAHPERRLEIDHVGDLREIGQLGADLERHLRQAVGDHR